jgi:ATP-binding cassette subfamily B protein RaxB
MRGTSLKQLISIAGELGLSSRGLRLGVENLENLALPCILHWDMNHFVVLIRANRSGVRIHDPALGDREIPMSEVEKSFTGVALEIFPSATFESKSEVNALNIGSFFSRLIGLKRSLALIFILALLLQFFALAMPFYMQIVVDEILVRQDFELLSIVAVGFSIVVATNSFMSFLRELIILRLSNSLALQLSSNLFHHLMRLPLDYFSKRHIGDIASRFDSLESIRELLTTKLVAALIDGLFAVLTLIAMFIYSPMLTVTALSFSLAYLLVRVSLYRPTKKLTEECLSSSAKERTSFLESICAIQVLKLFEKEAEREGSWQNNLVRTLNFKTRLSKLGIFFRSSSSLIFGFENIAIVYLAASAVISGSMSVGMLFAFISYRDRFKGSLMELVETLFEFKLVQVHLNRLSDIVHHARENYYSLDIVHESTLGPDVAAGSIEVKDLSYSYTMGESPVFSGFNASILGGEFVAITGASGCGKTTLLKCMMGLVEPHAGCVFLDGVDIKVQKGVRGKISAIMQDDQLLSGSVLENIAAFDDSIDFEKVLECAKAACIHDEILTWNMQYHTFLGGMSDSLSGGQKQRIFIARALYRDPIVLFMDEATSSLDVSNERLISQHISALKITRIVVAHRDETIRSADRVIVLGP